MAKYSYITDKSNNNRKIQVESAKRDGSGKNIENNYAKQDGYYETLGAGQADSIKSGRAIDNPELSCPAVPMGTAGGDAEIQTGLSKFTHLYGKSFKWNQLFNANNVASWQSWATLSSSNGVITLNGTATTTYAELHQSRDLANRVGHKILMIAKIIKNDDQLNLHFQCGNFSNVYIPDFKSGTAGIIFTIPNNGETGSLTEQFLLM